MANIKGTNAGTPALAVDDTFKAARVSQRPVEGDHYRLVLQSGLLTTVAAATATAGHIAAFRWTHATKACLVHSVRIRWRTIAGFTAAQEVGVDLIRATAYTASHTGGTTATLTSPNFKKAVASAATNLGYAGIGTTGALTAGTHTLDTHSMGFESFAELAAAATVAKGRFDLFVDFEMDLGGPLILMQNEGLIVRNSILMGAGGTARVCFSVNYSEAADDLTY